MITVQLADKALHTILRKQVEPKLPDIQFFKRPVTLEFQNLLAGKPLFEENFKKYFEPQSAQIVATKLKQQTLSLLVEGQETSVRLKLYQATDLQTLLPQHFKAPHPMEFVYFDVTIGKSFVIHQCSLSEDKEKVLGLTRIFILIAYDTLNHLKAPAERLVRTGERRQRVTQFNPGSERLTKTTTKGTYYFNPKVYQYLNPVQTVETVSRKRINRTPQERFFLKPEWERKGHWRRVRDRQTGEVKRRVWIEPVRVVIPDEKLKQSERTVRISHF